MRRSLWLAFLLLLSCNGSTDTSTTIQPPVPSTAATQTLIPGALVPADPATLVPFEDATPIVIGISHDGVVSADGRWAAIRSEQGEGRMPLLSIVDLGSLLVVADEEGSGEGLQVADDGNAAWFQEGRLHQLTIDGDETSVEAPEAPPYFSDTLSTLDDGRIAYLSGPSAEPGAVSVVTVEDEVATVHVVGEVRSGPAARDDDSVRERVPLVPDVAWDATHNRAIVISAEEDTLVVVDLESGVSSAHGFAASGSPGAEAASRDSFLTPDGSTLFIATGVTDVTGVGAAWESVESAQQVVAVDTSDWSSRLVSATADAIYPSPDGSVIATTGAEVTLDGEGRETRSQSPVFLIDAVTGEPLVGFEGRSGTIVDVQFSNDGEEMYVVSAGEDGTNVDIVDIASEQLAGSLAFTRISVIGEAGLLAFHVGG